MRSGLLYLNGMGAGLIAGVLLALAPARADAAELRLTGEIDRVTVYPGRAAVTRVVEAELFAGSNVLHIGELPGTLIGESLRATIADGQAQILSVETRRSFADDYVAVEERQLSETIRALRDERRVHEDAVRAARIQIEALSGIGQNIPVAANRDIATGTVDPQAVDAILSLVGERVSAELARVREAEAAQREIDREIERLQRQLNQVRTGSRETIVADVRLHAPAAGLARIELTYQVNGAGWRPLYAARLSTADGKLVLEQRAQVQQRSGESWDGVRLTLATSRPSTRPGAPELQPWLVDFLKLRELRSQSAEPELLADSMAGKAAQAPAPEESAMAQVVASEFQASYVIPGRVAVPADSAPHQFTVSSRDLKADLALRAVPKVDAQAYLYAEAVLEAEAPLPAGALALFRDDTFVGHSRFDPLRPGEEFRIAFGVDDKVRIEHRVLKGERSSEGIINKDVRHERRFKTTVTSYHARPVTITLIDQVPVPQDERIEVSLLDDTTQPDETDVDDRPGILSWTAELEPEEPWVVDFGYRLDHPEGERVPGF
ncbi:MAG: mucoidy inhibitor MuiA family protein [Rhodovibrionaceae bacterium]|nr:mucoidy inhibitor MuiA family protein [Rhodovibrionaceae bacterium]